MMALEDIFKHGPFLGEQLEDVIEDHPWYIEGLCAEGYIFDEIATEKIMIRGLC